MRILCDMDEVICHWGGRILQYYNEDMAVEAERQGLEKPRALTLDDIQTWDFKMSMGPSSEVYIRSYMRYARFYHDLEPVEGAVEGIKKLIADGHDVMIATAIPKCAAMAYEGKLEWLRKHIPELPLDNLTGIKRKDWLEADVLIDDGLHNIAPFWAKGQNVIVMDRPWNREVLNDDMLRSNRYWRAIGWDGYDGVLSCIRNLEAER